MAAERVMKSVSKFIEGKLKLKVNQDKSKTERSRKVKFLGITIDGRGCRVISQESMQRARRKVVELTPRGTHLPIEKSVCLSAKRTKPDRLSHSTCGERSMKESVHVVAPIKSVSIFAQISLDVFV